MVASISRTTSDTWVMRIFTLPPRCQWLVLQPGARRHRMPRAASRLVHDRPDGADHRFRVVARDDVAPTPRGHCHCYRFPPACETVPARESRNIRSISAHLLVIGSISLRRGQGQGIDRNSLPVGPLPATLCEVGRHGTGQRALPCSWAQTGSSCFMSGLIWTMQIRAEWPASTSGRVGGVLTGKKNSHIELVDQSAIDKQALRAPAFDGEAHALVEIDCPAIVRHDGQGVVRVVLVRVSACSDT